MALQPCSMNFIFDTETSGLPTFAPSRPGGPRRSRFLPPTDITAYDSSRIVSISWILSQQDKVIQQAYYVVRPDGPHGFQISAESQAIHGISENQAMAEGVDFGKVARELAAILPDVTHLVAHNIEFDSHVLRSEFYRRGFPELAALIEKKHEVCTMKKGREVMRSRGFPKLGNLYQFLYDAEMQNAHNAMYDTYYCFQCFKKMFPASDSVFFFGSRMVQLTDEQRAVVYENPGKHCLVIACAGSGKTTTTLCRIKSLIENHGVPEDAIMLTTFTRDAANDMRNKLFDILGYRPQVTVGTIDSIAKMFVERMGASQELKDVSEYGERFLRRIQQSPAIIAKYKYLFVDEYQDINDTQHSIIQAFARQGTRIFAVGDDAQNIYSFRGSKIDFILNFEKELEGARVHQLTRNFRSTAPIIAMANACIEKNVGQIPKVMVPGTVPTGPTPLPHVEYFSIAAAQNAAILARVKAALAQGTPAHEIAVLSPMNQGLFLVEELLTKEGVPCVYLDGKADVKSSIRFHHVCLSTIHKAKGLEWDTVFMIQLSDEILPRMKDPKSMDESRRLFYVGITRARKELCLYYYVFNRTTPYVTRYIAELSKNTPSLFTHADLPTGALEGQSDMDTVTMEMSVTKLLENLEGKDYMALKEQGILPVLEKKTLPMQKLWEAFAYEPFITQGDLYSDFGIFMEKFLKHVAKDPKGDKHVLACLAAVKLDGPAYGIYAQYKHNLKTNLCAVDFGAWSQAAIKKQLEMHAKAIQPQHMPQLMAILGQMQAQAKRYKVPITQIPVFTYGFLPLGFEKHMEACLAEYRAAAEPTPACIWELAKCKKIVVEYRRRLLYKATAEEELGAYEPLYHHLRTTWAAFLQAQVAAEGGAAPASEEDWRCEEGMYGETDLRVGSLLIDYKCSIQDDLSLEWVLQLLCYKVLCDWNQKPIRRIAILNPLRGWYTELDVSGWNKHKELVQYLLAKREARLQERS